MAGDADEQVADLDALLLNDLFPLGTAGPVRLILSQGLHPLAGPPRPASGWSEDLWVTAQLWVMEKEEQSAGEAAVPQWSIRDVKEQEILLIPGPARGDTQRLRHFLRAWADVLSQVLTEAPVERLEGLMPHELFATQALQLHSVKDEAGFRAAIARPSRLGRYLGAASSAGRGGPQRG